MFLYLFPERGAVKEKEEKTRERNAQPKKEHERDGAHKPEQHPGVNRGVIFLVVFLLALYMIYYNRTWFLGIIEKSPLLLSFYQHVVAQIDGRTLLGLFYAASFGALAFIAFPIEVLFFYYLSLDFDIFPLVLVTVFGAMLGMVVNYALGFFLGERLLRFILGGRSYERLKHLGERWGSLVVFLGSVIPSPIEPLALLMGGMGFSLRKFLVYVFYGKVLKFLLLAAGRDYFLEFVLPWVRGLWG